MRRKGERAELDLSGAFPVREATLPNGLKIRLVPDSNAPIASLYTFFKVGSRNERPGITGISHLFEHMMFNGAKKYGPKQFDRVLESQGGTSNAYTSPDLTVYHEEFASEALETVLDLESDRMRSLAIDDRSLASEREVVKEERRVVVDNEIAGIMDEELGSLVFKAHPYRWPVIGWMGDIERISRADCEVYFRTYYAPNNATLYLAGDFEPKQALALIRRYYGDIPKGPPAPPVVDSEPEQKGERRAEIRHPAQAPSVMVGYRAPSAMHRDTLALDLIQFALTVGEGCRLNRELVFKQEIAISVHMDWSWRLDPGLVVFFLELKPGQDPDQAERALYTELEKVVRQGLSRAELDKALNNLRAQHLRELSTNGGRAHAMGAYEMMLGSWRDGLKLDQRYREFTLAELKEVAERTFRPERRAVVTLLPADESKKRTGSARKGRRS